MRQLAPALLLLLAACRSEPAPPPQAAPAPAPLPTVSGLELGRVTGQDAEGREPGTTFGPRDILYAVVDVANLSGTAQVTSRWIHEGQTLHEEPQPVSPDSPAAEFRIMKASGWPPGAYRLEILLDGLPAASREFRVEAAPVEGAPPATR